MSPWGWSPRRFEGVWRHGGTVMRPMVAIAPWLTVLIIILMLHMLSSRYMISKGVLFELPTSELTEDVGATTGLIALILPMGNDTLVYFDDARYLLKDGSSRKSLEEHITERVARDESKTLLLLADKRVAGGELMTFSDLARAGGVKKLLLAEKSAEDVE